MPIARTIKDTLFHTYCRARNLHPIWYHVLNRKAKKMWRAHQSDSPNAHVQELISSLRRDGVAVTDVATLFSGEMFDAARQFAVGSLKHPEIQEEIKQHERMILERVESGGQRKGAKKYLKDFIVEPYGSTTDEIIPDIRNPFIRMNLDERVIRIAASYMGITPKLRGFSLRLTLPVPAGATEYFSQRWHRDPEDRKMVKMFIYMTDVLDDESGPFIYIKESQPGGVRGNLFPQHPPAATYPEPGTVERLVPRELMKVCLGRAGTIVFADTSGLHKGGYTTSAPRLMYTGTFYSLASLARHHLAVRDDVSALSPLARYALE